MDKLVAERDGHRCGYLYVPHSGHARKMSTTLSIDMGEVKKEIAPGRRPYSTSVKLNQPMMKWMDNQGPQMLINVSYPAANPRRTPARCGSQGPKAFKAKASDLLN